MLIDTSTRAVTLSAGRLIIHAEGKGSVSGRRLETTLRWLRALCSNNQKDERAPLCLQILDLQGNLMLASDDAGALVDVVIGGLISATILTLIVLPTLYVIFERRYHKKHQGRRAHEGTHEGSRENEAHEVHDGRHGPRRRREDANADGRSDKH